MRKRRTAAWFMAAAMVMGSLAGDDGSTDQRGEEGRDRRIGGNKGGSGEYGRTGRA